MEPVQTFHVLNLRLSRFPSRQNFSDMEIEMLFAKYDLNNDRELDADETKMMLADLDGQRLEIDRQMKTQDPNATGDQGNGNSAALGNLVSQQDFNGWGITGYFCICFQKNGNFRGENLRLPLMRENIHTLAKFISNMVQYWQYLWNIANS